MEKKVEKRAKKKVKQKKLITIIIIVIVVAAAGAIYYKYIREPAKPYSGPSGPPIDVNYDNFEEIISKNTVVKALPKKADVLLKFYNLVDGEKVVEKSYIITRGEVEEGEAENVDLTVSLPSRYLEPLNNQNFCSIMQSARNNQELTIKRHISKLSFAWRYRSMNKYKGCFGF